MCFNERMMGNAHERFFATIWDWDEFHAIRARSGIPKLEKEWWPSEFSKHTLGNPDEMLNWRKRWKYFRNLPSPNHDKEGLVLAFLPGTDNFWLYSPYENGFIRNPYWNFMEISGVFPLMYVLEHRRFYHVKKTYNKQEIITSIATDDDYSYHPGYKDWYFPAALKCWEYLESIDAIQLHTEWIRSFNFTSKAFAISAYYKWPARMGYTFKQYILTLKYYNL